MLKKITLMLMVALCVSACATPNLQPFADSTASLAASISTEHKLTYARMEGAAQKRAHWLTNNHDVKSMCAGGSPDSYCRLYQQAERYKVNAAVVDKLYMELVAYSNALAELAAAGETGKEAVESLTGSISDFGSAVGLGPVGLGSDLAKEILGTIALIWTRVEAQEKLHDAMSVLESPISDIAEGGVIDSGGVPAIEYVRRLTVQLYAADGNNPQANIQGNIIEQVTGLERPWALEYVGSEQVGLYVRMIKPVGQGGNRINGLYNYLADWGVTVSANAGNCLIDRCFPEGVTPSEVAALIDLVKQSEATYLRYREALDEIAAFKASRLAANATIAKAVSVWRAEHKKIYEKLDSCGGFKALRSKCGNLTVANLKAVAEELDYLVKKESN